MSRGTPRSFSATSRTLSALALALALAGCSRDVDTSETDCNSVEDCAGSRICVEGTCKIPEACETGETRACTCGSIPGTERCAPNGDAFLTCECDFDAGSGADSQQSDMGIPGDMTIDMTAVTDAANPPVPVDCSGVEPAGWELCTSTTTSCSLVFSDSTGCPSACAQLGLRCADSHEDVDGQCAADQTLPSLGCADTGHISDFCTCVGDPIDGDVGVDSGTDAANLGSCPPDRPWECLLDDAVGFSGPVTGGAGANLCWVENLNPNGTGSLADCLNTPGPRWIVFRVSGTIDASFDIPSDTTIDGRGQEVTIRGTASHTISIDSNNVVLSHLILDGAQYDLVHTSPGSGNVWLNHLTLRDAGDELLGLDGPLATVSWCRFLDNNYATLVGGAAREYPDLWVTFHHNYFDNNSERHPRTRGRVHSFNNYVRYRISGGRVSYFGQLLSEANVYEAINGGAALLSRAGGSVTVPGHYRSTDDLLLGGATLSTPNDPAPVFRATDYYTYSLDAADAALQARVSSEAGWQDVALPMP